MFTSLCFIYSFSFLLHNKTNKKRPPDNGCFNTLGVLLVLTKWTIKHSSSVFAAAAPFLLEERSVMWGSASAHLQKQSVHIIMREGRSLLKVGKTFQNNVGRVDCVTFSEGCRRWRGTWFNYLLGSSGAGHMPKGRCDYGFTFISGELWEMWTDDTVLHWHLTARRFWLWIPWGPEAFMRRTGDSLVLWGANGMEWILRE